MANCPPWHARFSKAASVVVDAFTS
ncbi:hypothetical protein D9611_010007 [Ephemerocybe angulata]|uniref:Uncharacterized protein n=1 Tax=Ephemerocybe angulata TaxID=980116 RepID=A0A8H5C4L9_9AGAR|nr:hypothetical protein D9611_010007 [Tulosesus angulatus]